MATENKSPEIRFAGFTKNWEEKTFDTVFNFSTGRNIKQNEASPDFQTPCVRYGELYHMYNEVIDKVINRTDLDKADLNFSVGNEILLPSAGEDPLDIGSASALTIPNVAIGRTINILSPKNDSDYSQIFASYYINTKLRVKIASLAKGVSISNVYNSDLRNLKINLPVLSEQNHIGDFLQNLDKLIIIHKTQLTKLKNLKKAMLVKMFPQEGATVPEIRFKGFDGEWENYQLGNIGNTFTGLSGKTKEDFGKGEARYIPYTNVFNNEVTDRNQLEKIEIDNSQSTVNYGDVLFTTSSETPEEVGMSSVWLEKDENVYLNSFCFGYRFKEKVDNYFIAYYMRSQYFRENMKILAQGISRFNISKTKVMEIDILLPKETEQIKIGKYFTNLDNLILNHNEQLKKLNSIKKVCLSKMFVA
ncbi:restriction endonuclease subunit S [Maribacter sp. X9]|uniref:restriction endonuclease subunit S n=1 Tax=Maribacter sp. X9 TaxID=3402159 RepID=UPI003AF3909B